MNKRLERIIDIVLVIALVLLLSFICWVVSVSAAESQPADCLVSEDIEWEEGVVMWGGYREGICGVSTEVDGKWYPWFPDSQGSIGFTEANWSMTYEIWDGHFNVVVTGNKLTRGMLYVGKPLPTPTPTPTPTVTPAPTSIPSPTSEPPIRHRLYVPLVRKATWWLSPPSPPIP